MQGRTRTLYSLSLVILAMSGCASHELTKSVEFVPQWTQPMGRAENGRLTERTAPVLNGEIVYAASLSGELHTLNRDRGFPFLPKRKLAGGVDGALAYSRAKLYVGDSKGNLVAYNSRDESEAWRFKTSNEWLSPPAVGRGKVIAVAGNDTVYALAEADGHELWHYDHAGDEKLTVHGSATPVIAGDEVFIGFADGYFSALNADTGKVKWSKKLRTRDRFYDIDAPAIVDDATVFVATYDGRIHALDRGTGETKWIFPVGSYGGFASDGDNLYFAGMDSQVYAVKRSDGKPVWSTSFERGIGTKPQLWNDVLVLSTSHDPLMALDKKNGKILATARLGAGSVAGVAVSDDGFVLALSNFGNLYAYRLMPVLTTNFGNSIPLWTGAVPGARKP